MHSVRDELTAQAQRKETMRQAEAYKLVKEARNQRPSAVCAVLAQIGGRLVSWGNHLQDEFGNEGRPATKPVDQTT